MKKIHLKKIFPASFPFWISLFPKPENQLLEKIWIKTIVDFYLFFKYFTAAT